jgi:Spx/MgsR family transcriptional regulator
MITVYGIPNCNTVKKAIDWLQANNINFQFHDYKKKGITLEQLSHWEKQVGFEQLLNKKGTTWRNVPEAIKATIIDANSTIAFLSNQTSAIKRPLIEREGKVVALGFDAALYETQKHQF